MGRYVAVTDLADYAVDPVDHIRRGGRPRDPTAARAGRKAHALFQSRRGRQVLIIAALASVSAAAFYAPHTTAAYALWVLEHLRWAFLWLMGQL